MRSQVRLHASTVAIAERAVLITGAAGSGKSTLSLQLMAHGAGLVADDITCLARRAAELIAFAPPAILGRIEARGVGILSAEVAAPTPVALVVDLDRDEPERLPPHRTWDCLGWSGPLLLGRRHATMPWAVLQYLKGGRIDAP